MLEIFFVEFILICFKIPWINFKRYLWVASIKVQLNLKNTDVDTVDRKNDPCAYKRDQWPPHQ